MNETGKTADFCAEAVRLVATNDNPLRLRPFCNQCGWRKGGLDSWDGARCKCGHNEPPIQMVNP